MKNTEITDPQFREAVEAIDSGNIKLLESLVEKSPRLITERLDCPEEGYFQNPYLLYFVADNPIRNEKLPENIVDVSRFLIQMVKSHAAATAQQQLDYTLGLIATGRIPRECGVQIEMIDLFINEGANPGGGLGALAHGNPAAAEHLIKRGGTLTLATVVGLGRVNDVERLASIASPEELLVALTTAAFYGKADMIFYLLNAGADPNGYPKNKEGFHSHATPLHQAVCSGSMDAVKLLVEAGAQLDAEDLVYNGTPLGWAYHMQTEAGYDEEAKKNFELIIDYLLKKT